MKSRHYPEIAISAAQALMLVREHLVEDPDYLNGSECPYSGEVKRFLALLAPIERHMPELPEEGEDLESNIQRVFKELNAYGKLLDKTDTTEKASYFRLSTQLLDKLVTLQERAMGLKRQQEFENLILEFLENEVSPDVRTKLMDRLHANLQG